MVDGGCHDDGLGGDHGGTKGSCLGDCGGGHGHIDRSGWRLGERKDDGGFFAIDAECVGGETLGGDNDGKSHEGQGDDGREHRSDDNK